MLFGIGCPSYGAYTDPGLIREVIRRAEDYGYYSIWFPDHIVIVGYLCLGYVSGFDAEPELAAKGWEHRVPLADVMHFDRYGAVDPLRAQGLAQKCDPATTRGVR